MPTSLPVPTKNPGDVLTSTLWNSYLRDNINKLLNQGHRVLTVAQFTALSGLEDGDEVYLEVDSTNGIEWHLRYQNAEPTYKWRFLGGPPLYSEVLTLEVLNNAAYSALATAGPSLTLSRAGDYDVEIGVWIAIGAAAGLGAMSYDIGGTGAVDADFVRADQPANMNAPGARRRRKAAIAASTTLTAKYKTTNSVSFGNRWMAIRPVRLI